MKGDQEMMRRLFEKYLAGECTPEEKAAVMAFFDNSRNEERVRAMIREEFEKEIRVGEHSRQTVEDVYRSFDWVSGGRKTSRFRLPLFAMIRPGVAAAWLGVILDQSEKLGGIKKWVRFVEKKFWTRNYSLYCYPLDWWKSLIWRR